MLNSLPFNGGLLNGGRLIVVSAAAAITCSVALSVTGVRYQAAVSSPGSQASFVAVPTHTQVAKSFFVGSSALYGHAHQNKAAKADFSGNAEVSAFVLRSVSGGAFFGGTANVLAIPASTLGVAQIGPATAGIVVVATKIHPGAALAAGITNFSASIAPKITRYAKADSIQGTASIRAETTVNSVTEAYGQLTGTAGFSVNEAGLVKRLSNALFDGNVGFIPVATHIKNARGISNANSIVLVGHPHIALGGLVNAHGTVNMTAQAVISRQAVANALGSSEMGANSVIIHSSASAEFECSTEATGNALRTQRATSTLAGNCTTSAVGKRTVMAVGDMRASAEFDAEALLVKIIGVVPINTGSDLLAVADTTFRYGLVNLQCVSDFAGDPLVTRHCEASSTSSAQMEASALRVVRATADILVESEITADSLANPFSIDPLERTFIRPGIAGFIRPKQITEFKRSI